MFFETGCVLHALPAWVHGMGLLPLQPSVPLPAACRTQRVNDEPVKVLSFLFFVYINWRGEGTFKKLHFFTFGPKHAFT